MRQFAILCDRKHRIGGEIFLFLFLVFGLFSCEKEINWLQHEPDRKLITIAEESLNDKIFENEIYDTVIFKPIFLPDSILIGNINDIKSNNTYYFAHDSQNEMVYQFDKDWKFLNVLNKQGGGPEEYNEIFNINVNDEILIVNDLWHVLHYNVETLDFLASYQKNHMGFKTYATNDFHVINHQLNSPMDDSNFNITTYNYSNDSLIYRGNEILSKFQNLTFSQKSHFFSNEQNEYFILPYNDTVYKVESGKFKFHQLIDFGESTLKISNLPDKVTVTDIVRSGKAFFLGDYFENENFILFSFTKDGKRFKYQINKSTGMGIGYSSLVQTQSPFILPIQYNLLIENKAMSFKNIEDANFEISNLLSRSESLPLNLNQTLDHFQKELKRASGLIVEYHLKEK